MLGRKIKINYIPGVLASTIIGGYPLIATVIGVARNSERVLIATSEIKSHQKLGWTFTNHQLDLGEWKTIEGFDPDTLVYFAHPNGFELLEEDHEQSN